VQERVIGIERSRVVSYAGIIARRLGDYTTARTYQQESLRLARQFHDEDMICTALGNLALLAENQGDYETAQQFRTEGMNIERARDNKTQLLNFLQNAGNIAQRLGDYETADAHFTECLALHEKLGDEEGHIWALFGLAETLEQRGQTSNARPNDAERATRIRTEAIARAQKFGDKEAIVYGLAMRAASSAEQGDLSGAYRDLADCLTTLEGMEGSSVLCEPLNAASLIAYQSGAATIAAQLFALLEATNERANTCPTPKEQRDLDHFRDSLCLTLGEADFAAAREAGRNLTTVEAVVLARTVL
jgi:tetratricopeptide (TPR) repeat protein